MLILLQLLVGALFAVFIWVLVKFAFPFILWVLGILIFLFFVFPGFLLVAGAMLFTMIGLLAALGLLLILSAFRS